MAPRISVFKTDEDLIEVGRWLYGSSDEQRRGLARAKAFEVRGRLPASVHLTCLLVSAVHGDVPSNDLYTIRLCYSMALIRFVNEILDAGQEGKSAAPLHALARDVDLPNSFVELRHAATHETLPSIYLLRDMTNRALTWLEEKFWKINYAKYDAEQSNQSSARSTVSPQTESHSPSPQGDSYLKDILKKWRRLRRQNTNVELGKEELALIAAIVVEVSASEAVQQRTIIYKTLLKYLIPSSLTTMSASISAAKASVKLWGPMIDRLPSSFLSDMAERLVETLNKMAWPVSDNYPQQFEQPILMAWLEYIVPSCDETIVPTLMEKPRPWNARAFAIWGATHNKESAIRYASEMASVLGIELPPLDSLNSAPVTGPAPTRSGAGTSAGQGPWRKVRDWTPRPIGL